jgi:putative transposase
MPRRARMYLPDLPYHVVQRGNNRHACFFEPEDYQFYKECLKDVLPRYGVVMYAWVLMTNHIHLLMQAECENGISQVMKVTGSRFAQYMNRKYQRTGTLWEGRHKSSPVSSEKYLLACYRYIELNPVRAGMVNCPEEYKWSSYGANGWGDADPLITKHPEYLGLGRTPDLCCYHYRELFKMALSELDLHTIRRASHYCQPLGDDRFRQQIESRLGRSLGHMRRGRPKREIRDALIKE